MDDGFGDIHNTSDFHLGHLHKETLKCMPMFMNLNGNPLCSINKIPELDTCLCKRSKDKFVLPEGSLNSKFVFCGQDPELMGQLDGEAGKILLEYFQALGISMDQVYFTNTVFCKTSGSNKVEVDDLYKCIEFKKEEFKQLEHLKYIFPLGTCAFQVMTSVFSSITPYVGSYFETKLFERDVKVIPLYHPGYILRRPSEGERIFKILRQLSGLE